MAIVPITHISLNQGPQVGADDEIIGVRVVPTRREGRTVFARTLFFGEPDNGEAITIERGDTLLFPPGSINISIADVDRCSEPSADGYAPVANTVWSWLAIPPFTHPREVHHYMLAAARRLDIAHVQFAGALNGLAASPKQPTSFLKTRAIMFEALSHAELMCIAFGRAIRIIREAKTKVSVKIPVPEAVDAVESRVLKFRDAFEHIDERAMGKAHHENPADAMTVFDQADFFESGVLHYAGHSLDIAGEVAPAMVAARKFIVDAVAAEGSTKSINEEVKWTFTNDRGSLPVLSSYANADAGPNPLRGRRS